MKQSRRAIKEVGCSLAEKSRALDAVLPAASRRGGERPERAPAAHEAQADE